MSQASENNNLPKHVGFILDGNRRWAKRQGLPTLEGHRKGFDKVIDLIDNCLERGIKHVTVFAFSTENWDRSEEEISYLMDLFRKMFKKFNKEADKKGVKVVVAGRLHDFPDDVQESAKQVIKETKENNKMTFNVAFSYGGHAEIVDATKQIIKDSVKPDEITEEKFSEYIYELGQPNMDLMIRTSGEMRTSGFMLWQAAYAELYFTETCWPDFDAGELDKALDEYARRQRRFGK